MILKHVKISLPLTYDDPRATVFRIYKIVNGHASVLLDSAIGYPYAIDTNADFGASYFYTAVDTLSGNESPASPIASIFRRRSTTPYEVLQFTVEHGYFGTVVKQKQNNDLTIQASVVVV